MGAGSERRTEENPGAFFDRKLSRGSLGSRMHRAGRTDSARDREISREKRMKRTAKEIADYVGGDLRGDRLAVIDSVASLKNAGPSDLTYAEEKFYPEVSQSQAGCVIVQSGDWTSKTVIVSKNPKLAFARAAAWLLAEMSDDIGIHPSATVAPDAEIGEGVKVGPAAVIESGVVVGNHTVIEAGCYVGKRSRIGQSCTLYPRAVIYKDVEMGNRVIVHAGAVIGADGFGFVRDGESHVKFPQVGRVIIEDD